MSATDELRRLLDERGVEWKSGNFIQPDAETQWGNNYYTDYPELPPYLTISNCTPEQAVAATLGRRDCKLRDCEGSFSAVNRPVWLCDCGAFMTQYTDATTYHKPNYCPNCGRVVEQ